MIPLNKAMIAAPPAHSSPKQAEPGQSVVLLQSYKHFMESSTYQLWAVSMLSYTSNT